MMKRGKARKETRDWLQLPNDVMANILYRVGAIDVLENAQKVCTVWHDICKDPAMWKVIRMENFWDPCARPPLRNMCKSALDRSQGQLVQLTLEDICSHELLMYIADRSSQLRRLEILYCYGDIYDGWAECADKFVLLEELSLHTTDFSEGDIEAVGRYCPLLKTLKLNNRPNEWVFDDNALAIGKSLPELRHLELIGNSMSNIGLQAILDGCVHLESLDLRQCFHIDLKGDLGKRCLKQIKNMKLPHDSLDRNHHSVTIEPKFDYDKSYEHSDDEDEDDDDEDEYHDDDDEEDNEDDGENEYSDDDDDDGDGDGDDDDDDDDDDFTKLRL